MTENELIEKLASKTVGEWESLQKGAAFEWDKDFAKEQLLPIINSYIAGHEEAIAKHIKGGALDGCMCDTCVSVREIVERIQAEARLEQVQTVRRMFRDGLALEEILSYCEKRIAELTAQAQAKESK